MMSFVNRKVLSCTLAAFTLFGFADVRGTNILWNGTISTDVNNSLNWTPNSIPGTSDTAVLSSGTPANQPHLDTGTLFHDYLGLNFSSASQSYTLSGANFGLAVESGGVSLNSGISGNINIFNGSEFVNNGPYGTGSGTPGVLTYNLSGGSLGFFGASTGQIGTKIDVVMTGGSNTFSVGSINDVTLNDVSSDSSTDSIFLAENLTLGSANNKTIDAAIVGFGGLGSMTKVGSGDLQLSNNNNYGSGTTIQAGSITVSNSSKTKQLGVNTSPLTFDGGTLINGTGAVYTLINPTHVTLNNGTLDLNGDDVVQGATGTLAGPGLLTVHDTGGGNNALILTLDNTNFATTFGTFQVDTGVVLEGTGDVKSIPSVAIVNNGQVQFNHNQTAATVVYGGAMSGTGQTIIGNSILPTPDVVQFTATNNTYSGGTAIVGGSTLIGNGENFPQALSSVITVTSAADTLNFAQTSTNTYAGMVAGDGVITTAGSGTNRLILTGDSSAFAGTTNIVAGDVNLNTTSTKLGGTLNMSAGALSGIGLVGTTGKTATISGGKVKPGNSIGTLNFVGNYTQNGGQYEVELNGNGNVAGVNNDLILVAQTATLASPAQVEVVTLDGSFWIGGKYTILTAGAVVGTFDPTVLFNTSIAPVLSYDGNNVYLDFRNSFLACAYNQNGRNVAEQLFTIQNPDAAQLRLLNEITSLSCPDIGIALDTLSGSQYAELLIGTELATHQFVRRLYDPIRTFLAVDNTCCDCCPTDCCCNEGIEVWVEGGGTHSRFKSDGGGHGFKNKGYQVTAGAQIASDNTWVAGAAIAYEHTNTDFNFGGTANTKTVLGALYGAYRTCDFYLLGDLAFGGSQSKLKRDFFVGNHQDEANHYIQRGKPEALQGILYTELGLDARYSSLLIQPFIGLEGGYFSFKHIKEHGDIPVGLEFDKRSYGTFDTRLGVHLSMDQIACGLFVGVDLAWQYRCTELNNYLRGGFTEFGNEFRVHGSKLDPNSFEAALNIEQKIGDNFSVFASGYWQQWKNANAYDVLAGVSYAW